MCTLESGRVVGGLKKPDRQLTPYEGRQCETCGVQWVGFGLATVGGEEFAGNDLVLTGNWRWIMLKYGIRSLSASFTSTSIMCRVRRLRNL